VEGYDLPTDEAFEQQLDVANIVGELIATAPNIDHEPKREDFATLVETCIEAVTDGNVRRFAKIMGVNQGTLYQWKRGDTVPRIDNFLRFCQSLGISPEVIIRGDQVTLQAALGDLRDDCSGSTRRRTDIHQLRSKLESVISERRDPPPSLFRVSKECGTYPDVLKRHFPELSKQISERYSENRRSERERARQILEEALNSNSTPPPSFTSVCADNGLATSNMYNWFPELCHAISANFLEHRARAAERKREVLRDAVRKAVHQLYENGERPTVCSVWKALGNTPYLTLNSEFRESFESAMTELNIT
jgi:transcriptional regulator with XRE-family HTH domain